MAKHVFESQKPAAEFIEALEKLTDKDACPFTDWTEVGVNHYLLRQLGLSFRLRVFHPLVRNTFSRAFYGKVMPAENGCRVMGVIRMNLIISAALSLVLAFLVTMLFSIFVPLPHVPVLVYVLPAGACFFAIPWLWRRISPRTNLVTTRDERDLLNLLEKAAE